MQDKLTTPLKRLNFALKTVFFNKGIQRKSDMATYLGYKSPYFSGVINGREKLSDPFISTITKKLGINQEWIMTGHGRMLTGMMENIIPQIESDSSRWLVPLVPVYAHAGSLSAFASQVKDCDCEKITSPLRDIDLAITVAGESMSPDYPNGSILLIKKIDETAFIEWGKAFVLDTRNGIVIKVLVPSDKPNSVRCLSINRDPIFAPFDIPHDDIFNVYAVKFCMVRK